MRVTLRDIAQATGVSPATVSRILNNKGRVGKETAARVLEAARSLGYPGVAQPAPGAADLSHGVGVLFNRRLHSLVTDPFYGEVMVGIEETLRDLGYHLILRSISEDEVGEGIIQRFHAEIRVDGLLLTGCDIPVGAIRQARESGIPCILVDNEVPEMPVDAVIARNRQGVWDVVRYLYQAGHRRIGYIGGPQTHVTLAERYRGYLEASRAFGLQPDRSIISVQDDTGRYGAEVGYYGALSILASRRRPTAIIADNDLAAIGALKALQEKGVEVPAEVSLFGFDDIPLAAHTHPPLSTVRVPRRQMGTHAALRLVELIEKRHTAPFTIVLHTTLVPRASCAPVAAGAPQAGEAAVETARAG